MEPTTSNELAQSNQALAAREGIISIEQQRAIAEVQGAIISARRFPRDVIAAVEKIKLACQRPTLAAQAMYTYARGGTDITGPSIRLVEAIAQNYGNIACGVLELSRSNGVSECMAYAWDLETNYRDEKKFTVRHTRDTKRGSYELKDERDIYEAMANVGARRKRACLMAIIPGDIVEEAVNQCEETMKADVKIDAKLFEKLLEAFAPYKVTREMIEKRIQRKLDAITPAQVVDLRKIITSLKDGMSAPGDWFEVPPPTPQKERLSKADMAQAKSELENQATTIDLIKEKHPNLDPDQLAELAAVKVKE